MVLDGRSVDAGMGVFSWRVSLFGPLVDMVNGKCK